MYDLPPDVLEQPGLPSSPDGGDDRDADVAALPDNLPVSLYVDEGETVYDYAWYPGMLASELASCVFATSVRVRLLLWDLHAKHRHLPLVHYLNS